MLKMTNTKASLMTRYLPSTSLWALFFSALAGLLLGYCTAANAQEPLRRNGPYVEDVQRWHQRQRLYVIEQERMTYAERVATDAGVLVGRHIFIDCSGQQVQLPGNVCHGWQPGTRR